MNSDTSPTQNYDSASVAFIDLAGFSAIADVYGDAAAIDILEIFESMVREALGGYEPPIKWIGDEAMLSFPEPESAIQALGNAVAGMPERTAPAAHPGGAEPWAGHPQGKRSLWIDRQHSGTHCVACVPRPVACHSTHRRGGRCQRHSGAGSRKGGAAIGSRRSPTLRDRACSVARPGLDRSRVQDACSVCILSTGRPGRAVVLFAALRRGVSEVAADLSVAAMTGGLGHFQEQARGTIAPGSHISSVAPPQAMSTMPAARLIHGPREAAFRPAPRTASAAIHTRFITPPTNNAASPAIVMTRSLFSRRSRGDAPSMRRASGSHHPVVVEMQPGELAVRVLGADQNGPLVLLDTLPISARVFEAVRRPIWARKSWPVTLLRIGGLTVRPGRQLHAPVMLGG